LSILQLKNDCISSSKIATQEAQYEILRNTTRVEGSILQAVTSTSDLLQYDIKSLTEQLRNVSLDSVQQIVSQFTASHRDLLEILTKRLDSILDLHMNFRVLSDESQMATARQIILDSLHFPQIYERRDLIYEVHDETYRWILEPKQRGRQNWDDFVSWLGATTDEGIYWIHGKIGAGKSTLLRFLDDNLTRTPHAFMGQDAAVVRASYFFWNAGNKLQKSMPGLLRTWLAELLEQTPELIAQVVQRRKWQVARLAGNHAIEWTVHELKECLRDYILYATMSRKIFLLVDGLDEIEGTDEVRQDLINLLRNLAVHKNVKICVSSRPLNIFRDSFRDSPQLKLEDLTYNDIRSYVHSQFYGNKRFQDLMQYDSRAAETLVTSLVGKASGVFLWVRLVVNQLLQGLRDGDGIRTLMKKVEDMPTDLDDYFMCMIESIAPQDRQEASQLLQLALYEEDEFVTLHSNRVVDFLFIEEGSPDFALKPSYDFSQLCFADRDAMAFRLGSTLRKLNSRCMGLLHCHGSGGGHMDFFNILDPFITPWFGYTELSATAHLVVDFIHKSLRDFLRTPKVQTLLHQYTNGPYDARMYFRSARLVQLVTLNKVGVNLDTKVGLASYILSTLTVPGYRDSPGAAAFASLVQPVVEELARAADLKYCRGWYIWRVLFCWHFEDSTFLTLALDFGLDSYVRLHLTPQNVHDKKGRPILDYILRPRFVNRPSGLSVGHTSPDMELLHAVLRFGADPNQLFRGVSVWALFLCFIADQYARKIGPHDVFAEKKVYLRALKTMIQNGAKTLLPRNWLSTDDFVNFPFVYQYFAETPDERFQRRFPNIIPILQKNDVFYAVADLLQCFCPYFEMTPSALKSFIFFNIFPSSTSEQRT
jgi:hypothetical protein